MSAVRKHQQQRIRPVGTWPNLDPPPIGPVSLLRTIDTRQIERSGYQRRLIEAHVRKMVRTWDPEIVGHVILSLRTNGRYFVIDGQHRIEAIRRMDGRVPQFVEAIVWEGLSSKEEAEIFWRTQSPEYRKALAPEDIHNAAVYAGSDQAIAINQIVNATGFRIGLSDDGEASGRIKAVKHLYDVDDRYGRQVLYDCLDFLGTAWGTTHSPEAALLSGTAMFLAMFPEAKRPPLARRVGKTPLPDWVKLARKRAGTLRLNSAEGVASLLHDEYNIIHKINRLNDFSESLANHRALIRQQASQTARSAWLSGR